MLQQQTSNNWFYVFVIALFLVWATPGDAFALTISPARIELQADPGQTIEGEFLLINEQDGDQTFYVSTQNFEAQGETGTPNFTSSTEGLASWVDTASQVSLKKGEQKKITYSITVPANADAGGYFSAIFLSSVPPATNGKSEVSIGSKVGTLLLLRVNGEVEEGGGIVSFGTKNNSHFYTTLPILFNYRFTNDGGDRVNPKGSIVVRNMIGIKTTTLDANASQGNILPGGTRRFDVAWGEVRDESKTGFVATIKHQWNSFALGIYMAKLSVTYGTSGESAERAFVFVLPWQLLLVMSVIITGFLFAAMRLIKRYNRWIIKKAQSQK